MSEEEGWWCFGTQMCSERPLGKTKMQKAKTPNRIVGFSRFYSETPQKENEQAGSNPSTTDAIMSLNSGKPAKFMHPDSALSHWAEQPETDFVPNCSIQAIQNYNEIS